jgi:hypothetical protein
MYRIYVERFNAVSKTTVCSLVLASAGTLSSINFAIAQEKTIPVCQPPSAGEFLLLVNSPTKNDQSQLNRALPTELKTTTCTYLNQTVTRIGGFKQIDDANRWARYISNIVGLSAVITTRPAAQVASTQPREQTVSYEPRQLGNGFAVLVDYFNRPEVASEVRRVVEEDIGFVSYGQRPYLLAVYTDNQKEAYDTLQKLSESGFFAVIVDSRKVVLLRDVVRL